jgi:DNA adenine methylase
MSRALNSKSGAVMDDMKIKGIAPWFGAKRIMADTIIAEFGKHRTYWEPFCGAMAVLLKKEPCCMETVNDLHGDLVGLARTVQHPVLGPLLYRKLRRVLFSKEQFIAAAETIKYDVLKPEHDRAFDYFMVSWFGRNGVAGTAGYNSDFCVRYTSRGGSPNKRWESAVNSIPAWRRRLKNVTILSEDGIALCERIADDPGTVIYADPPYLKKGSKYKHDFDWLAHRRLATALRRFKNARIVVSYYEHPDLADLYPGWTKRECTMTKSLVSQGRRDAENSVEAPEVLLINGPSFMGVEE